MLEKPAKKRRYCELNGLKVELRFAEKPLYTVRGLRFQVTEKNLDPQKEKPKPHKP